MKNLTDVKRFQITLQELKLLTSHRSNQDLILFEVKTSLDALCKNFVGIELD